MSVERTRMLQWKRLAQATLDVVTRRPSHVDSDRRQQGRLPQTCEQGCGTLLADAQPQVTHQTGGETSGDGERSHREAA